jgi:hypothetical protein
VSSEELERRATSIVNQAYRIVEGFMCDEKHNDILDRIYEDIIQKSMGINKTITTSAGRRLMRSFKELKTTLCKSIKDEVLGNTSFRKDLIDIAVKILREKNSTAEAMKVVREELARHIAFDMTINVPKLNIQEPYFEYLAEKYKSDLVDTRLVRYQDLLKMLAPYSTNPLVLNFMLALSAVEKEAETTARERETEEREVSMPQTVQPPTQVQPQPARIQRGQCIIINNYLVVSDREFPEINPQAMMTEVLRGLSPRGLARFTGGYKLDLLKESDLDVLRKIPAVSRLPTSEEAVIHPGYPYYCGLELYGVFNAVIQDYAVYAVPHLIGCLRSFADTRVKEGIFPITKLELFNTDSPIYKEDKQLKLPNITYIYLSGVDVHKFGNALADLIIVAKNNSELNEYLRALAWGLVYDFYTVSHCVSSVT